MRAMPSGLTIENSAGKAMRKLSLISLNSHMRLRLERNSRGLTRRAFTPRPLRCPTPFEHEPPGITALDRHERDRSAVLAPNMLDRVAQLRPGCHMESGEPGPERRTKRP